MPPHQTEQNANIALANLLKKMMHGCDIFSENTNVILGHPGLKPDILITAGDRAPVVIEAEYMPAAGAEGDARSRLGKRLKAGGSTIEAVIALRYPDAIAEEQDLAAAISSARLSYCVMMHETKTELDRQGNQVRRTEETRFPTEGWLDGSVSDLADLVRLVSVSQSAIDTAANQLEQGIERAVAILDKMTESKPDITQAIAQGLGMTDVPPTRRMACAIIANALVFHERIAGMHQGIKPLNLLWQSAADNPQDIVIEAWDAILEINYWAIFAIARDMVMQLPSHEAMQILRILRSTAQRINATGASFAHDLTGRIFQRLISDRKYLATFYTLPASAALLARLAVAKLQGVDWSDAQAIGRLRVGDFACGTGALLSAVYEEIATRHERTGGDPAALHKPMMEDVLYGCDVMPSAIHITSSTLSGIQPNERYGISRLYALPYGRQKSGTVAIGSLELLQASSMLTLFNTNDPALRTGSIGEETAAQVIADIPDNGFDIVIMNPPFTRATNHEGAHANVVNPAFAAFEATKADMNDMGKRMRDLGKASCYDGKAGLASAFTALANRKLKPGGVFAFVLPLSVASGTSWKKFRQMLGRGYTDLDVLSIAANGKDMSFSADTGMAECLVVARKRKSNQKSFSGIQFTSLNRRPSGFAHSNEIAKGIANAVDIRGVGDGPYGGTSLAVGLEQIGDMVKMPTPKSSEDFGVGWGAVRIKDYSVAQTAYALAQSKLWLPTSPTALDLNIKKLSDVGKRGLVDRLILGPPHPAPFTKSLPSPTATYPSLWNHYAKKETRMICEADISLRVRQGMEAKAAEVWATASRAHLNREYTFGSQPLAVAFTERESIGGTVWPNVIFEDNRFDYAFTVWGNSTLGLLCYWWHSNRQQSSKARMTISSADSLPILDMHTLSDEQLLMAELIFDEFRTLDLLPAYLADADPNRALLDERVLCDMLGFDAEVYEGVRHLAAKWCAEPSVHGGKRRPRGAALVV